MTNINTTRAQNFDDFASIGLEIRPMKNLVMGGADFTWATSVCRKIYVGGNFQGASAKTDEKYGFTGGMDLYHVAEGEAGVQVMYKLVNRDRFSLFLSMKASLSGMWLGDTVIATFHNSNTGNTTHWYHDVAANTYVLMVPGIEIQTNRISLNAYYNFINDGDTQFGNQSDFEGPCVSFDYSFTTRKGRETSLFEETHYHHHHHYRSAYM